MYGFKEYLSESKKLKWKKVPVHGLRVGNKKTYKHVTTDGRFEISLSGMDTNKKNRDGSQKVMPTLFDNSGHTPRKPNTSYQNVEKAKKNAQQWADNHWD
jgi:hypothetical protein